MSDPHALEAAAPYIAFGILGVFLLVQLYYILFVYSKLARYRVVSHMDKQDCPPVSVIICAHNEEQNLLQYLPAVLEQDYPCFEVVVVNDCSDDDTARILQDFASRHTNLRVVEIHEHIRMKHGKKFAVTMGIKAAKYDTLVFTDADCVPHGTLWLREMAGAFDPEIEITLGYSPYFRSTGLLNLLIRFETTHTAMSYLSYALAGDAYMGVGRNMAYRKDLFFRNKGFATHMHIKSGDDDLFVNKNATRDNVAVAIGPEAVVYSAPKTTWKSYYKQKARHSGASTLYRQRHKRMLAVQLLSALFFYAALLVTLILFPQLWYIPVGAYVLRLLCQVIIFRPVYKKLEVKDLIWWLPLLDLFYYFYICINGLFSRKKKKIGWK